MYPVVYKSDLNWFRRDQTEHFRSPFNFNQTKLARLSLFSAHVIHDSLMALSTCFSHILFPVSLICLPSSTSS